MPATPIAIQLVSSPLAVLVALCAGCSVAGQEDGPSQAHVRFGTGDDFNSFQEFDPNHGVPVLELELGSQGAFMAQGIGFRLPLVCSGKEVSSGARLLPSGHTLEQGFESVYLVSATLVAQPEALFRPIYFEMQSFDGCVSLQETIMVSYQVTGGNRVDSSTDVVFVPPGCGEDVSSTD